MLTLNEASQLDRWLTMEPDYYVPSTEIDTDDERDDDDNGNGTDQDADRA